MQANNGLITGDLRVIGDIKGKLDKKITIGSKTFNNTADISVTSSDLGVSSSWNDITDKPSTFTPSSHNHNDLYYTESEIDTKLGNKSDTSHTHDEYVKKTGDTMTGGLTMSYTNGLGAGCEIKYNSSLTCLEFTFV